MHYRIEDFETDTLWYCRLCDQSVFVLSPVETGSDVDDNLMEDQGKLGCDKIYLNCLTYD